MTSIRTNLGPLTTPFTYPASCNVVVVECTTCSSGWMGQSCGNNTFNTGGVQDNTDCWPPRQASDISTGFALNGWGYYSPGLGCPVGFYTACASTPGVDGGFPFQFSVLPQETAVGCCPSGYSCSYVPNINAAQTCYKYHTTGSFPTVQCSKGTSNKFSYVTVPATVTATVAPAASGEGESAIVTVIENVLVYAPLIQINWQSSDRLTSSASPSATTSTTSQAASATPTSAPENSRLSHGAIAGIAVAAVVVGLLLVGAFLVWRRRRRPKVMPTLPPNPYAPNKPQEMSPAKYVAEAPTERAAHEMEGPPQGMLYGPRHELEG